MPKQKPNEQVQQIPLSEIRPFKNHPFKVTDDELMQQTIDSIMQVGVLNPAIIRPAPEGGYEMVAGHRRLHAADLAGLKTIPAIVRNLDDDEAVILMCVDFAIHDTDSGNPHCHIMLTMRPLDGRGAWAAKSKKEYDLDKNGERIRLPSGRYKTHKVDLTGWNDKDNTLLWRKAWADFTNDFLERNGSTERIDHRSNAERGIDEIPTVHMGVAACQMEKRAGQALPPGG